MQYTLTKTGHKHTHTHTPMAIMDTKMIQIESKRDIHAHPTVMCMCIFIICTWIYISLYISLTHIEQHVWVCRRRRRRRRRCRRRHPPSLLPRHGSQRNLSLIRWHTLLGRWIFASFISHSSLSLIWWNTHIRTHNNIFLLLLLFVDSLIQRECFRLFWLCRDSLFDWGCCRSFCVCGQAVRLLLSNAKLFDYEMHCWRRFSYK